MLRVAYCKNLVARRRIRRDPGKAFDIPRGQVYSIASCRKIQHAPPRWEHGFSGSHRRFDSRFWNGSSIAIVWARAHAAHFRLAPANAASANDHDARNDKKKGTIAVVPSLFRVSARVWPVVFSLYRAPPTNRPDSEHRNRH